MVDRTNDLVLKLDDFADLLRLTIYNQEVNEFYNVTRDLTHPYDLLQNGEIVLYWADSHTSPTTSRALPFHCWEKFMRALLLTAIILGGAIGSSVAQKKSTFMGDIVVGELTARDEATREITVKYPGKEGPEIFSGFLVDGYKLKMDASRSDLKLSEILPGMHIRVWYKSGREKVSGQEKKINKISKIEVLGNDEFFRIRNQLNLDPSTTIAHAEKDDLPAQSPLKVYLAIAIGSVHQHLVEWIDKWNRKNGDKLEVVSDVEQADIFIVTARGADTMAAIFPVTIGRDGTTIEGQWSHATSYLVVKDVSRLKLLWTGVGPVFSSPGTESSNKTNELVTAELEKRMKARTRK